MKTLLMLFLAWVLMGCTGTTESNAAKLPEAAMDANYPVIRNAPEIVGDVWINTSGPLRIKDLQGKVVLIDMWTFG